MSESLSTTPPPLAYWGLWRGGRCERASLWSAIFAGRVAASERFGCLRQVRVGLGGGVGWQLKSTYFIRLRGGQQRMFGLVRVHPGVINLQSYVRGLSSRAFTHVCVRVDAQRKKKKNYTNPICREKNFLSGRLAEWQSLIVVIMGSLCHCR